MTLLTRDCSTSTKTKGCAITYRSGDRGNQYKTCPTSCPLNPTKSGSKKIDIEYTKEVARAVPRGGAAWLYTHFQPDLWKDLVVKGKTVFNYSCDSLRQACFNVRKGIDCVVVVPSNFWNNTKNKVKSQNINIIRCPAEYMNNINCRNCGGSQKPLCVIQGRSFIVGFTAHGSQKKKAEDTTTKGGCYAGGGNVNIHWNRLAQKIQKMKDHIKLKDFVNSLPSGGRLRHHVAGDLGKL